MFRGRLGWYGVGTSIGAACYLVAILFHAERPVEAASAQSNVSQSSALLSSTSPQRAQLNRYCVTCHNQRLKTAGLMLDVVDVEHPGDHAEVWEKVVRKLRTRTMPPVGAPRPEEAGYASLIAHLETALDRFGTANPNPGRIATFHRLNRVEYANAIRDLLAVDIDTASLLPVDDAGHGFDNVAEMLSVSPVLVERYLSAAERVSRLAIGDLAISPFTETYGVSRRLVQEDRVSDDLPFGSRGGIAIRHHFPLDGEYVLRIRLRRSKDNYIIGLSEPHQLDVRLDGALIERFTVGGEHKGRAGAMHTIANPNLLGDPEQEIYEFTADAGLEVRFSATAGVRLVGVAFLKETWEPESELLPRPTFDELAVGGYKGGIPAVDGVAIGGPYDATGLGDTPSRRKILVCRPSRSEEEEPCAKQILSTLARRAYRRPVTDGDIRTLLGSYRAGRNEQGFEAGIRRALQRMLVSPQFLFRIERDPANVAPDTAYRISNLELASRLSFFLWSSIPDDDLLHLAELGRLTEPAVLEEQVRRMLADARSKVLVRNFAGQWLSLRKLETIAPDATAFPYFDDNLREALQRETELFFESLLLEDRSVLDVLDADYTFLNARLARHYGIPDIFGNHFRRVELSGEQRRGVLGHGSFLTVTSYGNRTAPTLRGAWILENVLGTPPPPPPPDIPALKEDPGDAKPLTMRERMQQHRENPACAVCHRRMDPLGFALENFDALGRWRDIDAGMPIDPSGAFPDGTQFQGPAGLRQMLLSHPEPFVHTFTEKLLTYALGRSVEFYDAPALRKILREAAASDYRLGALITGIVKSTPFQMRRSRPS